MKTSKIIENLLLIFFVFVIYVWSGCSTIKNQDQNFTKTVEKGKNSINLLIKQLISPKYFEYTQAARTLVKTGDECIPYLINNIDLTRESNNALIPVCYNLLKVIFQKKDAKWLQAQLSHPNLKVQKLARKELKKREKIKNRSQS